jgi:DNA-binding response OmpR family regulator
MSNALIVEDEIFIAMEVESVLMDMGHAPVGIAVDTRRAMELAANAEIAIVDFNLRDGPTGMEIGRRLAERGVTVLFITANPSQLGDGVPGALGVLAKPVNQNELKAAINFIDAVHRREHPLKAEPPRRLKLFDLRASGFTAQQTA